MPTRPVPTNIILEMNKRGYKDVDIIRYLKEKGYTPTEMSDGFHQAKVKLELDRNQAAQEAQEAETRVPAHSAPKIPMVERSTSDSNLQIFQIKLRSLEEKQKQQIAYMEQLRNQVIKKIQEDSSRMKDIAAEVAALHKSFSKILEPLASNVKAKSGMLDLNKTNEDSYSSDDSDEDRVVVIKETTKTVEKTKPKSKKKGKKKDKPSLDDQF